MNEIITKYKKSIYEISNLQKQLFSIEEDESSFNNAWDLFENSSLIDSSNTSNIEIYYKFIMLLVKFAMDQNHETNYLYITFVSEFYFEIKFHFMPYEIIKLYQNEPSILDDFIINKIISIDDIVHYLNNESIIENFGDEILSNSSELLKSADSMKSIANIEYLISQINLKHSKENVSQISQSDDDDNELVKYIKEDDINNFQLYISSSNTDINKVFKFQKRYSIEYNRSLSLIELAAKSNSIKIFKFLFIQPTIRISNNLIIFAISGRSYDIIHMCESNNKSIDINVIKETIRTHQNEIFYYFIEKYEIEYNIEFLYFCLDYCNLALFFELLPSIQIDYSKEECLLIHKASFYGFYYVIEILLKIKEFEIFVDKMDSNNQTPIMIATNNDHIEIVRLLINTNKISKKSIQSSIIKAVTNGSFKCVEYLLDFVDINDRINGNSTLLHIAIFNDHLDIVKLLLSRENIDVNVCSSNGFLPIHNAIILGNEKVVELLLKMPNIDKCLNAHSELKESPLITAQKINNQKIITMIQNHIAKKLIE